MGKAASVILTALKQKDMSQRQLASEMGEDARYINQQLHRQQDMKVERFIDVLEHIGYRLEIVDNNGIRKVTPEFADEIIASRTPEGLYWYENEDGFYIGIDNSVGEAFVESFASKQECFKWLKGEPCVDYIGIKLNS